MFPSILKVEANRVCFFFWLEGLGDCYSHFVIFWRTIEDICYPEDALKTTKCHYLASQSSERKIKPTLFPSILKVSACKVLFFFLLKALGDIYSHFAIFGGQLRIFVIPKMHWKQQNSIILPPKPLKEKQSQLCFLQF